MSADKKQSFNMLRITDEYGDEQWIAQTHCTCGTTMQSDSHSHAQHAIDEVTESMRYHLQAKDGKQHQVDASIRCRCDACKAHDHELAKLVGA